jgi:hypothetical protein
MAMNSKWRVLPGIVVLLGLALPLQAQSVYSTRLDDPEAIDLGSARFPVHADGASEEGAASDALSALSVPNHQIAARKMLYPQSEWQDYPVRTVEDITFAPKAVPLDRFGGRLDRRSVKTGFFYTRKIAGRWWLIDPDGHPFLNAAIVSVIRAPSPNSATALAKTFGTQEAWLKYTRDQLLSNGFNGVGAWSDVHLLRASPAQSTRPLAYTINLDIMGAYGAKRGGTYAVPGHKGYPENTIFAFDPAFKTFADRYVAAAVAAYRTDSNLIGYFSDNEIPLTRANLDGFLRLPDGDPGHKAAERWLRQHHATEPTDALRAEFLEFEADHYFRIVSSAISKSNPNHLFLGSRFYGQQPNDPEVFRAVGRYAGAISINIYGIWQLDDATTEMWERESGKPFMVTEFYAKGEDSGMPNHTGAGWLVHTQDDRGMFYENFVLALIQSRNCVGWHWFKYQDNDPDDPHAEASNKDSNKGIVDRYYKPYSPLLNRMRDLNLKMYEIADAFDAVRSSLR